MTQLQSTSLTDESLSRFRAYLDAHELPFFRGIEKEGLRTAQDGFIAQTSHPKGLGHPLTHSGITTDYSEALLELITQVHASRDDLMAELRSVHQFVQSQIGEEYLWAGSMPCQLDGDESIRIAEYGESNIGQLKHVYRQGLGVRYGRIMQSIAGLHFNFSLSDEFWIARQEALGNADSLQDFKSEQYFGLIRNFRRYAWLLMYLFGASPVLDQSFLENREHDLDQFDDKGSFYKPYATSLRMGDLGYHNNAQSSLSICFNTLSNFTTTLGRAVRTSYAPYEKIGMKRGDNFIQLNTNILQIENEYYSTVRPKRSAHSGERPTDALIERGVEYVEVRCLDLNPFFPLGICEQQIDFMDIFLTYCLLQDSPGISDAECKELDKNFSDTVNEGRNPELVLTNQGHNTSVSEWGMALLNDMQRVADLLDAKTGDERYARALKEQVDKIQIPELTPSAKMLSVMQGEALSWLEFAKELSNKHQICFNEYSTMPEEQRAEFEAAASRSFEQAEEIKAQDNMSFAEYLGEYNQY